MSKVLNYNWVESDLIDKYYRIQKKEQCAFKDGTIAMVDLSAMDGIWALVGTTIGDENKAIYAYLFEKKNWTEQACMEWVDVVEKTGQIIGKDNTGKELITKIVDLLGSLMDKVNPPEELATEMYADLKELKGVEIFATGKWNGDMYSEDDLKEMVNAFKPLKQTLQPFVKLGHNDKQPLLAKDGLPAAGWIENIYIRGNKLLADIKDMPATIYELIKNKAYKRISSEIYWNLKDASGKIYKRALKAIALLGGDTPAVGSLADVQALYTKRLVGDLEGNLKIAEIEYFTKEDIMELEQLKAQVKELTEKLAAKEVEIADLQAAKKSSEQKVEQFELNTVKSEVEKRVDKLITDKKLLPAEKQYAINKIMGEVSVKIYSEKKEKMFDDSETVKFFEARQDVVKTTEMTKVGEVIKEDEEKQKEVGKAVKEAKSYDEAKKVYSEGSK